jgi:hypothetical protein
MAIRLIQLGILSSTEDEQKSANGRDDGSILAELSSFAKR